LFSVSVNIASFFTSYNVGLDPEQRRASGSALPVMVPEPYLLL